MVEAPKIPDFTPEIESQLREFLRPGVDKECVEILFNYLVAERFGVWELFRTDVKGFSDDDDKVTMDMADHIVGHAWAEARAGYGLPKMDLGISFWFGKLNRVLAALQSECEKFVPTSQREDESLIRMKQMLPKYCREVLGSLDRNADDINALIKQGYNRDLRFGDFTDYAKPGNNYSFFIFLLPFYRDEDGRSLLPAYQRRVKFLEFFEGSFRPKNKRGEKKNGGWEQDSVAEAMIETAINAEMILGLSRSDEIVDAVYRNRRVIEDFSTSQILDLIAKMTNDSRYRVGQGDTKLNFILEMLIYALARKIDTDRESANEGLSDIAGRVLLLLGERAPIAWEIFPPIIAARKDLLALFENL